MMFIWVKCFQKLLVVHFFEAHKLFYSLEDKHRQIDPFLQLLLIWSFCYNLPRQVSFILPTSLSQLDNFYEMRLKCSAEDWTLHKPSYFRNEYGTVEKMD